MDASDHYEILSGSLVGLVPVLLLFHMSISVCIISQLQLWYLHWLVFIETRCDPHFQVPYMLGFLSHGYAAPLVTHQHLDEICQYNIVCFPRC